MNTDQKLTSVKVDISLFDKFKEMASDEKFTFQKLSDRAMYLYITDAAFRTRIQNQLDIKLDGK
jgi:hypothetical protein